MAFGRWNLRMMRRVYPIAKIHTRLWLLLPMLLALAQQGAWLHELGHAAYAAAPHHLSIEQPDNALENGPCPTCQSFGQLASALATPPATLSAALNHFCSCSAPQYSRTSAQPLAPRNRGPPSPA